MNYSAPCETAEERGVRIDERGFVCFGHAKLFRILPDGNFQFLARGRNGERFYVVLDMEQIARVTVSRGEQKPGS